MVVLDGEEHEVDLLENLELQLDIPPVPADVVRIWQERNIEVSDAPECSRSKEIHVMIGADYINHFRHSSRTKSIDVI